MSIFYQSFLLRIWKTDESDSRPWQASLENPQTHTIVNFPTPEALFCFLQHIADSPIRNDEFDQ